MKDTEVFAGKQFSDLLRDIHDATLHKRSRIDSMINELRKHINQIEDAVVLAPIIKDYLDVLVRNDEHMVKVAVIVQRMIGIESGKTGGGIEDLLSDDEKSKLMKEAIAELDAELKVIEATPVPALATPSGSVP